MVVTAMRARELGRTSIVVGDDVGIVGDLSGKTDTLARIVRRGERRTVLRRTADDTDPTERVVVANADQLLIVVALADPPPRTGLVERTLIAAYAGGLEPILCLTKTDLAPPEPFAAQFADLDLTITIAGRDDPLDVVAPMLADKVTVALPLSVGGWVVDTPGIRSFGLAHIEPDDVMMAFSDLAEAIKDCPRGCGHMGPPADPECALDTLTGPAAERVAAARRLLGALSESSY
jgi:ribosome biogenesis GTPase